MSVRLRLVPFIQQRDRAMRLPVIVVVGLGVLLVAVWNPVTTPGPTLCGSRLAFGIPCPLCGGTRGAALALRGHVAESIAYNPLSIPALLFAFWLILRASIEVVSGNQIIIDRPRWLRVSTPYLITFALVATWVYLLMYRIEDDFASSWVGQLLAL
jgi:Protein of unknown function (DUF2752)